MSVLGGRAEEQSGHCTRSRNWFCRCILPVGIPGFRRPNLDKEGRAPDREGQEVNGRDRQKRQINEGARARPFVGQANGNNSRWSPPTPLRKVNEEPHRAANK